MERDAGGALVGTHEAASSGIRVARLVHNHHTEHRMVTRDRETAALRDDWLFLAASLVVPGETSHAFVDMVTALDIYSCQAILARLQNVWRACMMPLKEADALYLPGPG